MHEQPAEILVNDADLENDACWSVKNPKGQYKVKIESCPTTGVLVREPNGKVTLKKVKAKEDNTWEHTLLQPNRALQTWRMMVLVTEWQDGFDANSQDELTKAIARKFPISTRAISLWVNWSPAACRRLPASSSTLS